MTQTLYLTIEVEVCTVAEFLSHSLIDVMDTDNCNVKKTTLLAATELCPIQM